MSTTPPSTGQHRLTITLPQELLERLLAHVPADTLNTFIIDAIDHQVGLIEQAEAIEEGAGAWKAEDHPDMLTGEDIDTWLVTLRTARTQTEAQEAQPHEEAQLSPG